MRVSLNGDRISDQSSRRVGNEARPTGVFEASCCNQRNQIMVLTRKAINANVPAQCNVESARQRCRH